MVYTIGVSSGIFGAQRTPEEMMQYSGLYKKAQFSITKGVSFVQIDLESISEFKDPDLEENMKNIKRLGVDFGIHSEVAAFGGREFPHLDSAIDIDYERGHKRLIEVFKSVGKLGSKFVLIHSSESTPFLLLGQHLQPSALVDIWGRPFWEFLDTDPKGEDLKKWSVTRDFIKEIFLHGYLVTFEDMLKRDIQDRESTKLGHYISSTGKRPSPNTPEWEKYVEVGPEERKHLEEDLWKRLFQNLNMFLRTRSLNYGPERFAYYIIAKWMELNDDQLWNDIINASTQYYAKVENKTPEEWLKEKKIEKVNGKWSIDNEKFRLEHRLWVPAVSAKYVWGHMMQDKCPTGKVYDDPKEYIKKFKMPLLIETPMAGPGLEEYLRFPNPLQIYYLAKAIGTEYVQLAIDIEHMLMSNQDPEKSFDLFPEGAGKYVKVIHAGWPSPLGPAHIPIPIGSEQQHYLYEMYYKLRQKGFGKDPNTEYFLVFERAGGADPIQQSILALRMIKEQLEKDTPPDKLPLEFFGISSKGFISPERQRLLVFEHRLEPLKGMLAVPEEEYTFLSKSTLEKGKRPEEWKKEEMR